MREWRNWQTRTFEGRVVHTVRVQVPFLAPTKRVMTVGHHPFGLCDNKDAEPLAVAPQQQSFARKQSIELYSPIKRANMGS